jgi:hypothetical protein
VWLLVAAGSYHQLRARPKQASQQLGPLTTLVAVRLYNTGAASGTGTRECSGCDGKNSVDPRMGDNTWVRGLKSNQTCANASSGHCH